MIQFFEHTDNFVKCAEWTNWNVHCTIMMIKFVKWTTRYADLLFKSGWIDFRAPIVNGDCVPFEWMNSERGSRRKLIVQYCSRIELIMFVRLDVIPTNKSIARGLRSEKAFFFSEDWQYLLLSAKAVVRIKNSSISLGDTLKVAIFDGFSRISFHL